MTTFCDKRNRVTALLSAGLALALSACGGSSSDPTGECKEIPGTPTNLTATVKSSSEIELSWTASAISDSNCSVSYRVHRGADVIANSIGGTTYADTGLTPNTSYSYTVEAVDSAGKSEVASVTATTQNVVIGGGGGGGVLGGGGGGGVGGGGGGADVTAPSDPTNLRASNLTTMSVTLSWTAATDNVGVVAYDVYYGGTMNTVTGTSVTAFSLSAGSTYTFTVKARDAAGNASAGAQITVVIPGGGAAGDTTPPSAPSNLRTSNVTSMGVYLTWNASTDDVGVTGYAVYDGATQKGTVSDRTSVMMMATSGTTYNFTVVAFDAAGNVSTASNLVTITMP